MFHASLLLMTSYCLISSSLSSRCDAFWLSFCESRCKEAIYLATSLHWDLGRCVSERKSQPLERETAINKAVEQSAALARARGRGLNKAARWFSRVGSQNSSSNVLTKVARVVRSGLLGNTETLVSWWGLFEFPQQLPGATVGLRLHQQNNRKGLV